MPAKRALSAATPTRTHRAAKTPPAGAQLDGGASWMSSYLETCAREDKAMRDMVKMVEDAQLNANICLYGGEWHVELYDANQQVSGVAYGEDLTDALSRAWTRCQEARAVWDAKDEVGAMSGYLEPTKPYIRLNQRAVLEMTKTHTTFWRYDGAVAGRVREYQNARLSSSSRRRIARLAHYTLWTHRKTDTDGWRLFSYDPQKAEAI